MQIRVPYQDLMRHRILHILLVSTPYDRFLLEEAGELSERVQGEFRNLDVHYAPGLAGVSTGAEALELVRSEESINLVITTPHVADMDPRRLAAEVKKVRDIPVVLLAWDPSELNGFGNQRGRVAPPAGRPAQGDDRRLLAEGAPYLLIGVGRWGSRDPWLGIPVTWSQVAGAKVIVEAGLRDLKVTPSQGSHFFQSLTSFNVGYFTVNPEDGDGHLDWDWLDAQPAGSGTAHVRHLRLAEPLLIKMNGRKGEGVILKPGRRAKLARSARTWISEDV